MKQKLLFIVKLILIFPILLLMRLIKPWKVVRIGMIPSNSYGGMLVAPEVYLCHIDKYGEGKNFDVFYFNTVVVNTHLANKQRKLLRIWQFAAIVDRFNRSYLGWKDHYFHLLYEYFGDEEGLLKEYPCHLTFTKEEHQQGEALMMEIGIPLDKPLVCFFNRDAKFVLDTFGDDSKDVERKQSFRNTDINDYLPAAEYLVDQGYFVIRMGKANYEPIKTSSSDIFDYVFCDKRSEFLDLYIFSRCTFAFGCATGISMTATLFRKPVAYANIAPFFAKYHAIPDYYDLFLPNKYFLIDENRLATLDEIMKINIDNPFDIYLGEHEKELKIRYLKSSPEDIKELIKQMNINVVRGLSNNDQSSIKGKLMKIIDDLIPKGSVRDANIPDFYILKNPEIFGI